MNLRYLFILFTLFSCATIRPPQGGDKDTTPPQIVYSSPDSAELNFMSEEIIIQFDEYFKVKDFNTQVIISPPFEKALTHKIRKKQLIITLPQYPKLNTTYQLNLGSSIADNNEGNVNTDLNLVFSTGNEIDSGSLSGRVIMNDGTSISETVKVFLYSDYGDSNIILSSPYYITNANKTGQFSFKNINYDNYSLVSFDDKNQNNTYEVGEAIGFLDSNVSSASVNQQIELFVEEKKEKLRIEKFNQITNNKAIVQLNKTAPSDIQVSIIPSKLTKTNEALYHIEDDSVIIHLDPKQYSVGDTILLQIKQDTNLLKEELKYSSKNDRMNLVKGNISQHPQEPIVIKSSHLFQSIDTSAIRLFEYSVQDSSYEKISFTAAEKNMKELVLYSSLKPATNYKLIINEQALGGLGSINLADTFIINSQGPKGKGSLEFEIKHPEDDQQYVFQILQGSTVFKQYLVNSDTTIKLNYLTPSDYEFLVITDNNRDGKWTTGDYLKRKAPEEQYKFKQIIQIKPNWTINDIEFNIP